MGRKKQNHVYKYFNVNKTSLKSKCLVCYKDLNVSNIFIYVPTYLFSWFYYDDTDIIFDLLLRTNHSGDGSGGLAAYFLPSYFLVI